ncbi:DUF4229 domain-containing protein [Kocuria sp. CPCC 205263]|uniref:DUF4229 domain-containing protein n=1 Tax=Kocuria sp. CPCC 205263 TaxID=3073555 RepID=UPI0034D39C67
MNFLKYSLLRFALLVLAFLLSMWLGVGLVLSGVAAVVISFAVSYLFLPRLHSAAGEELHRWFERAPKPRNRVALEDQEVEDAYVDRRLREDGREV